MFHVLRVEVAGLKVVIGHDFLMKRNRRMNALNDKFIQRALHAFDRFGAVFSVRNELGDQRIIKGRNFITGVRMRIDANTDAAGHVKRLH